MSRRTTLEQALLDALSNAEKAGDNEKARIYKQALDTEREDDRRDEIDRTFSAHQYKNVHFGQLANVRDNPANWLILKELSPKASKLLLSILVVATSEYIAISHSNLADLIGEKNKSRIKSPLQELVDSSALSLEVEYDEKTNTPAIYRISSAIFRVGKTRRASEEDIESYFGDIDSIKDMKDMKEWLPLLFRRINSPDHNTDGAGYYPSSKKMRIPSKDATLDGYKDVIVSTIQYYSGPPVINKERQPLTSKQKKSSADKPDKGSDQPTTNHTYGDDNTPTSNLSSLSDAQIEQYVQSMYCPEDDNSPSEAS